MFKIDNENTRTTSMMSFWCFHYKLWTYLTPFSTVSIVVFDFDASWVWFEDKLGKRLILCITKDFFLQAIGDKLFGK